MDPGVSDGEKAALLDRYRSFVDRLTPEDLAELRSYALHLPGPDRRIQTACREKLMFRLLQYFHEDVLERELPGIEALLHMLGPEDLRT